MNSRRAAHQRKPDFFRIKSWVWARVPSRIRPAARGFHAEEDHPSYHSTAGRLLPRAGAPVVVHGRVPIFQLPERMKDPVRDHGKGVVALEAGMERILR
jgi:hypothetical protein